MQVPKSALHLGLVLAACVATPAACSCDRGMATEELADSGVTVVNDAGGHRVSTNDGAVVDRPDAIADEPREGGTVDLPRMTCGASGVTLKIGVAGGGPFAWLDDKTLARELTVIRDAGAGWVRFDFDWGAIEPKKGSFNWANADRVVAAVTKGGLKVLGVIAYTPSWARAAGAEGGHGRPSSPAEYGRFAADVAKHFEGKVADWEIWNEPNLQSFFLPKPNVGQYAELLAAAYTRIHAAVASVNVLSAGLAPATDNGTNVSPVTFVKGLYAAGGGASFDALAMHPYSYPALPSDATTATWNTFYRLALVRELMVDNGDAAKKIWLTEFGAPTGTSGAAVTKLRQAAILADGLTIARSADYLGPLFVYTSRDQGTNLGDPEQNFGLVHRDFSPKPAYLALRAHVALLCAAP